MYENDYMYAIERNDDYLAHYGIKGMKWGVRKAIESGNSRRLARAYKKASRKLARLEKRANNGAKYARRAAMLGAGAAAAGGLAAAGTGGVANAIGSAGRLARKPALAIGARIATAGKKGIVSKAEYDRITKLNNPAHGVLDAIDSASKNVRNWGESDSIARKLTGHKGDRFIPAGETRIGKNPANNPLAGMSNNTYARIAAGALGAGLAGAAGYNAYRAATTKKAAAKAQQWRSEMNKAFKGTQYANGGNRQGKKRRR